LEELAAMAATFLLLLVMVQAAMAMTARSAADAVVASTARRASLPGVELSVEEARLEAAVAAVVPGADDVTAEVRLTRAKAIATASFRWTPPGPVLARLTISVRADVPRVIEP
jgi:hypothetical protein